MYKQRRRNSPQAAADSTASDIRSAPAGAEMGAGVAPIGGSSGKTAAGRGGSSSAAADAAPPPPAAAGEGGAGPGSADGEVPDAGGEDGEGAVGGLVFDIGKLQSSVVETLNSGHLESIKTLRETLMAHEWELHAKRLAMHRGVANFEHYAGLQRLDVDYDAVTRLYQDPSDLSVLANNQVRLMARSMIEQAVDERYLEVYAQCTTVARDLASMNMTSRLPIPVPGAGAMSGVAGVVRSIAGGLLGKHRP